MNGCELGALRRHLLFSVGEAARWIAADRNRPEGVEQQAWIRWEEGGAPVPEEIAARVWALQRWQEEFSIEFLDRLKIARRNGGSANGSCKPVRYVWYAAVEDFPGEAIHWRPHCSALAGLKTMMSAFVELVSFDAEAFAIWRQRAGLCDSMEARNQWAAEQPS